MKHRLRAWLASFAPGDDRIEAVGVGMEADDGMDIAASFLRACDVGQPVRRYGDAARTGAPRSGDD